MGVAPGAVVAIVIILEVAVIAALFAVIYRRKRAMTARLLFLVHRHVQRHACRHV